MGKWTDQQHYLATVMLFKQPDGSIRMVITHCKEPGALRKVATWIGEACKQFLIDWG